MSLEKLTKARAEIQGAVNRFRKFVEQLDEKCNIRALEKRVADAEKLLNQFNDVQSKVENISEVDDNLREEFENNFYESIGLAEEFIKKHKDVETESLKNGQAGVNVNQNTAVQLPVINLPKFSGFYTEWTAFYDSFQSLIHNNNNIADIQKFLYLKGCLLEDAKRLIDTLPVSADNYSKAWTLLIERYENKRLIVQHHIHCIFNLKSVSKARGSLRELLDGFNSNLAALKTQGINTDTWDAIFIYLLNSKFDFNTKREWEGNLSNELPTLKQMINFLTQRCLTLESIEVNPLNSNPYYHKINAVPSSSRIENKRNFVGNHQTICAKCTHNHYINQCPDFLKLNIGERLQEVKKLKLCYICLKSGHESKSCRGSLCKTCNNRHHFLLHINKTKVTNIGQNQNLQLKVAQCNLNPATEVLLSTAVIECCDKLNNMHKGRALLDPGSQQHLISENLCQILSLKIKAVEIGITGVCKTYTKITKSCTVKFKSLYSKYSKEIKCLVVPVINSNFPVENFDKSEIGIPENIYLADPNFNISAPIDLLIGAELFWDLLEDGRMRAANEQTTIQNTTLGWILGGPFTTAAVDINNLICSNIHTSYQNVTNKDLDDQIRKFWELDSYNSDTVLTKDEKYCEKFFEDTYTRDSDGRFIVSLPFKTNNPVLGSTKDIALKRFRLLENKFCKNPQFHSEYLKFMNDYSKLGHMEITNNESNFQEGCLLPHHGIIKQDSVTTKLRAVFDASCRSTNGTSLNDLLLAGPNLQKDLFSLLVKFRRYQYVLSADIIKMFRQIWVADEYRKFQRIFWRTDPHKAIEIYDLKTVTYGTICAPYLAMKCLQQLALEAVNDFPEASRAIREDFYMDDLLTGANSVHEAIVIRDNIIQILKKGGFELAKWASNNIELIPTDKSHLTSIVQLDSNMQTKTLGLNWNCVNDTLGYGIKIDNQRRIFTKRVVLSTIATIYDPIGLLSPVLISAKLILQKLWKLNYDWDERLPLDLFRKFEHFLADLPNVNKLTIPRKIIQEYPYQRIELHGFSDASSQAYGAVIYVRTVSLTNKYVVNLVCAKGRITPLKQITLPRLELSAAVLLANLMTKVRKTLNIKEDNCYLWSDSTITLAWIASSPNRWQTFVSNRVSEIQGLTENCQWRHIRSEVNPADIISRGISAYELKNSKTWWYGPPFLLENEENWPNINVDKPIILPEERKIAVNCVNTATFALFNKFSSYKKLKRVVAYCIRFYYKCLKKSTENSKSLTLMELEDAHIRIIKLVQEEKFSDEIQDIKSKGYVKNNSNLKALNIFLDKTNILRVGGRLQNSNLEFYSKHQILLPKHHSITKLIINEIHTEELHSGVQATLAAVRKSYWPIAGRNIVREVIHKCIKCYRINPKPYEELMGNLPADRVTPARPFLNCGVDYAGPIVIKLERGRSKRVTKSYVIVFVCLATKAIHLEFTFDYTAESFLNALKRMMARRGKVSRLYSDNGTNFVGANNEMKKIKLLLDSNEFKLKVVDHLVNEGIEWKFIPPRSPYVGGIWEAGVKSFKQLFRKVTGSLLITIEEMHTLLTLIEACLNSRPLTPLSNDPNDLEVLTPGHFPIGSPITAPIEPQLIQLQDNRLSRWQRIEKLRQQFWVRWHREYLSELQRRNKWKKQSDHPIKVGNLVVLRDEALPPMRWKLGRVIELHPGADGIVRVVTIKTDNAVTKRGVNRLCVLPIETSI